MSGSQFQQFNEDLNKMLGSTQTVSIACSLLLSELKFIASATHCQQFSTRTTIKSWLKA